MALQRLAAHRTSFWALGALLGCLLWLPSLATSSASGEHDWGYFYHHWELIETTLRRSGSIPFWNPFQCGGVTYWRNPQATAYSPAYWLLVWPFGSWFGAKVYVVVHAALGGLGMARVANEEFAMSRRASLFATAVWTMSGFFVWHLRVGHVTFVSFYLAPWVMLYWRKSWLEPRKAILAGAFAALALAEGGHITTPHFALWIAVDAAIAIVSTPKRIVSIVKAGSVLAASALAFAAYRLAPSLVSALEHNARETRPDLASTPFTALLNTFTDGDTNVTRGLAHMPHEHALFVGWPVVALAMAGVAIILTRTLVGKRRSEDLPLLVGAVFFTLTMAGGFAEFSPWTLLHKLPVYRSLHVSTRFGGVATFYYALLAARALGALLDVSKRLPPAFVPSARALISALSIGAIVLIAHVNGPLARAWSRPRVSPRAEPSFYIERLNYDDYRERLESLPENNVGTNYCYEPIISSAEGTMRFGRVPQAWLEPATAGEITGAQITAAGFHANVRTSMPATLYFNQRYDAAFVSEEGDVRSERGHVVVRLDAPHSGDVVVTYRPDFIGSAGIVSLLSAIAAVAYFARRALIRRRLQKIRGSSPDNAEPTPEPS